MSNDHYREYHNYLLVRSLKGSLYKKLLLYPKISKHLQGKVLDIGCGVGGFLAFRKNTVGLDVNPYNVDYCRKLGHEAYHVDGGRYPFEDNSFDGAVLDNVLEHLEDPAPLLTEVYRTLGKDGVLIVGVPGKRGYLRDPEHKVYYSKDKLVETVSIYGFKVLQIFAMPFDQNWLESRLRQFCIYSVFQRVGDDE